MIGLTILYTAISIWLAIYGLNAFVLIWFYFRHRQPPPACPALDELPTVTVQIPLYNERYVVERVIDAVAALDWPQDRLQIQVLDDSTDETSALAQARIAGHRQQGLDIRHIRRETRRGFKAGALNAGLQTARGEYVALFDADFCPEPEFLQRTVPHLVARPKLAFVQARWSHLNDGHSILTLAQSIALDGHFAIEHAARQRAGLLKGFNGTGGVWRTKAIQDCQGWDETQLTEDVDLAYRAQLEGWQGLALTDVSAPAEIPVTLAAFKQQQFRWAKGNLQCCFKLAFPFLRAPLPWMARLQALIHLSYYLAHPLMLLVVLGTLPMIVWGGLHKWTSQSIPIGLTVLSLATLGPPTLYTLAQRALYADWVRRLRALPVLVCTGLGLALNSTVAAVEAILGIHSAFERTPKIGANETPPNGKAHPYALRKSRLVWGEIALTLYAALSVYAAWQKGQILAIPFLLLYVIGFGYVSVVGISES